jgi:hypothetical protein
MKFPIVLAGLLLATPTFADIPSTDCDAKGCPTVVPFASTSDSRSYGLLVAAPDSGCAHVRFRVHGTGARLLGQSPPLAPGELAVVRIGRGFPEGENQVTIASVGCDTPPAAVRRVILANVGPDHSWRAQGF